MAFQVGSACYETAEAANAAAASSLVGSNLVHGGQVVVVDVVSVTASTISYSYTPLGGTEATTQTFAATPQPCGLLGAGDAVEIGWLVLGALFATYAVMFMTRGLRDHGDS